MKSITIISVSTFVLFIYCGFTAAQETFRYGEYSYTVDDSLPEWVKTVEPAKSNGKPEKGGQEYLLVDTQILSEDGRHERFGATSMVFHTSQAVASQSEIHLTFNPSYQELIIHSINIVRDGNVHERVDARNIRLLQREEDLRQGIYDGVVTAVIIVPDTRVGDRLDYSYTVKGRNPVYGTKIFGAAPLGWSVELAKLNLRLLVPRKRKIQTRIHLSEIKEKIKRRGQYTEYLWTADDVPAYQDEGDYPNWYLPYPWMEFSEFKDWGEVEEWATALYESIEQGSEALDQIVASLQDEAIAAADYASAALKFVQEEVRYLGLEFGQNSHLPRSPVEVLENRFGDCKDKANLLVQVLRANGIEAYPTLVSMQYRHGFEDFLPSPLAFDHVITMAVVDGVDVWLDATKTFQGAKITHQGFTPFGKGLVVGRKHDDPIADITALPTQLDQVSITEQFTYSGDSENTLLAVETEYAGSSAELQRFLFSISSVAEMQDNYLNFYVTIYPDIEIDAPLTYADDADKNRITVTERYRIPGFSKIQDKFHTAGFYASGIGTYLVKPKDRRRESPINIGDPKLTRHKLIVDFEQDAGMVIDSTPSLIQLPEVDFRSRSAYFSKRFEYESTFFVKQGWVEKQGLSSYFDLVKSIENDIDFSLSFLYPYQPTKSKARERLINRLEAMARE